MKKTNKVLKVEFEVRDGKMFFVIRTDINFLIPLEFERKLLGELKRLSVEHGYDIQFEKRVYLYLFDKLTKEDMNSNEE